MQLKLMNAKKICCYRASAKRFRQRRHIADQNARRSSLTRETFTININ